MKRWSANLWWLAAVMLLAGWGYAQEAAEPAPAPAPAIPEDLLSVEPFDVVTLTPQHGGRQLRIRPLELPERRPPVENRSTGRLRVRLVDRPDDEFDISWKDITRVTLYEELVMQRAVQLTRENQWKDAYRHYQYLLRNAPQYPGLDAAIQNYLYLNAGALFMQQDHAQALAVLEELYRRNPQFQVGNRSTLNALDQVASTIVQQYVERQDYGAARRLIERLDQTYKLERLNGVRGVRDRIVQMAAAKRDQVRSLLAADRLQEAHEVSREMMSIWPQVEQGSEVLLEVSRRYPLVIVGVPQLASSHDAGSLLDWAARRTGRLVNRSLVEMVGVGTEGGQYRSPWAIVQRSDDRRQLEFQLRQNRTRGELPPMDAYTFSRRLLELSSTDHSSYLPAWASVLDSVAVNNVFRVQVTLRKPHLMPEALLREPARVPGEDGVGLGPYQLGERTDLQMRFLVDPELRQPEYHPVAEIIERRFEDPRKALDALRRGEVDVLDHINPADALELSQNSSLVVSSYAVPTVHVLVPNPNRPFTQNRTFRRALVYGIDRQAILQRALLRGQEVPGCRVLSAPLPAGITASDAIGYAYDQRIRPRPYNPRLAKMLVLLAQREMALVAEKRGEPAPELGTLVLGHPPDPYAQLACEAIRNYLAAIGITCELKARSPGPFQDAENECDLVYAEVCLQEPLVDCQRLFSAEGIGPAQNAYVDLALRQLDAAIGWREARERLTQLHQILHDEVAVVPLWQLVDYYAHQRRLRNVGVRPVTLYQEIERWQMEARGSQE